MNIRRAQIGALLRCTKPCLVASRGSVQPQAMRRTFFVEKPLSWATLETNIAEGSLESLGKLGRFESKLLEYRAHRAKVR